MKYSESYNFLLHVMTPKAFSIYFLLKAKNGLANLWILKKIKQEKNILDEETVQNLIIVTF